MAEFDENFKLIFVGDVGVGKSSLVHRFSDCDFTESINIIDTECEILTIRFGRIKIRLEIWKVFRTYDCLSLYGQFVYSRTHGVFIVYDTTNINSYKNVLPWFHEIDRFTNSYVVRFLVGNKTDLSEHKVVDTNSAKELATSLEMPFFETSAKNGTNADKVLMTMVSEIICEQYGSGTLQEYLEPKVQSSKKRSFVKRISVHKIWLKQRIHSSLEKIQSKTITTAEDQEGLTCSDFLPEMEMIKHEEAQSVAEKQEELEKMLIAAPASVELLSRICIVSSTSKDFRLLIPLNGFKHVKSEWFRGALMQVVNKGAQCFALANKNVAIIESLSKDIPGSILEVLQLLLHGSRADVETLLPENLESIIEKASQCMKLASETEAMFESVVTLINELAEIFTATRSEVEAQRTKEKEKEESSTDSIVQSDTKVKLADVDFQEVIDTLLEGLKSLVQVRVKWNRLTRFFTELAQLIRIEMQDPFETFKEVAAKKADKQVKHDKKLTKYAKETFRSKAQEIAQKGFQVNMITVMFLHVSQNYVQAPLLRLDELLTLTENDLVLAEKLRQDITVVCTQAQKEIEENLKKTNEDAYAKFRAEMDAIEQSANFEKKGWNVLSIFGRK